MRVITDNEATAARRVVLFPIVDDTANAAPWAGSTTGVKALLSVNGGTETPSTADIRRVAGVMHALDLTQAEVNLTPGDLVVGRVPAATGRREAFFSFVITAVDVTAAGVTDSSIATAVTNRLAGVDGAPAREAFADSFLGRAVAGGTNSGRTVARALKKLVNRWTRTSTTLTVYEENDSTIAYTETLTESPSANPVTGGDPS